MWVGRARRVALPRRGGAISGLQRRAHCARNGRVLFAAAPPQVIDLDVTLLDKKIDQMMPELGFK